MKKNSKTIAVFLGLAVSAALPLAAHAQASVPGIYVGFAAGQAEALEYECDALPACKKKGTVYRLFGGYQFSRNFGVEVGISDLGHVSSNSPSFDEIIKVKLSDLSFVGAYHATERFSIFGKVGVYYAHTSDKFTQSGVTSTVKESNTNLTFGAGLQWFMTQNLALRGEGQRYMKVGGGKIGDSDYNAYTVGLVFKFQ